MKTKLIVLFTALLALGVGHAAAAGTEVLVLNLAFQDAAAPHDYESLVTLMTDTTNALYEMSYRKTDLHCTIPNQAFLLPGTMSFYIANGAGRIATDAKAEARQAGIEPDNFDIVVYFHPWVPGSALGTHAGEREIWSDGPSGPASITHEFGHVYGVHHAAYQFDYTGSGQAPKINPDGSMVHFDQYGDRFDMMGSASTTRGHFSMYHKALLNWIEATDIVDANVVGNGVYRIYRFDHIDARTMPGGTKLALRVANSLGDVLWVGFRRNLPEYPSLTDGAFMVWSAGTQTRLTDWTPFSKLDPYDDKKDAALPLFKSYTDPTGSFTIRPVGCGGIGPFEYLDVQVTLGSGPTPPQFFTDTGRQTAGLVGSYVSGNLWNVNSPDWRTDPGITIRGTRTDTSLNFTSNGWGSLTSVGLTPGPNGTDTDWDNFSVQWDGVVLISNPMALALSSSDGSRLWLDIDGDNVFASDNREFYDNAWGKGTSVRNSSGARLEPGVYKIRIQYHVGGTANQLILRATAVQFEVFTRASCITNGLVGSYVAQSLKSYVAQDDWRISQTIAGVRRDTYPVFTVDGWGTLASVGLASPANGSDADWNYFSVQWDGFIRVYEPTRFCTCSDDGSRMWIDLDGNGFGTTWPELIDNGWGQLHGYQYGAVSVNVSPGTYALRIQYYAETGGNSVSLLGAPVTNSVLTWTGLDPNNSNWSTPANWSPGAAPTSGDSLVFPAGAARLVNVNDITGLTLNGIAFTGAGGGYTISGQDLTLSGGITASHATGGNTISANIGLGTADQVIACLSGGTLTLSGVISGSGGLTKSGSGTLVYSGSSINTHSGTTHVKEGLLELNKAGAVTAGSLVIGDGVGGDRADEVRETADNPLYSAATITINGSGLLNLNGHSDTVTRNLTMNGNAAIETGTSATLSLQTAPTVNAPTAGSPSISGNLNISDSSPCTFNIGAGCYFSLNAIVSGAANIIKNGAGRLFFNTNNTFTGSVSANDGRIAVTHSQSLGADGSPASGTIINDPALLQIWNAANVGNEHLTLNTVSPNHAVFNSSQNNSWAGPITLNASQALVEVAEGSQLEFSGVISGAGSLRKNGTGTMKLGGNNTYTGVTWVYHGKLVVNGSQPQSAVTVENGAALGGSGTIGNLTANGEVSPGVSPGALFCSGVTFGSSSSLRIELNGPTAGSEYDALRPAGTVNLTGASLQLSVGFLPKEGDQFIIVNNTGGSGDTTGMFDEGSVVSDSSGRFRFQVAYPVPPANDVALIMINQFLAAGPASVWSGNGNGAIEPIECNFLSLTVNNLDGVAMSGVSATLQSLTPGVVVVQPHSTYPDIPASSGRANNSYFQITTQPGFVCGANVNLALQVATTTHGTLIANYSLPTACTPGSGICELCPNVTLNGFLGAASPQQYFRVYRNGVAATCAAPKDWPGLAGSGTRGYDAHAFRNGPSDACITVSLSGAPDTDVFSAAYQGSFDPANLSANYLADCGSSTAGGSAPRVYSFNVAANQVFVVTVNEVNPGTGNEYTLSVTGGVCRPVLNVTRANPSNLKLEWTTAAPGYHLEGANLLNGVPWDVIPPNPPAVVGGKFTVTDPMSKSFYRLHKP